MKSKFLFAFLLIAVVTVAGCTSTTQPPSDTQTGQQNGQQNQQPPPPPPPVEAEQAPESATVEITSAGFSPSQVTVRQGGSVTWTNTGTAPSWPASAVHPTHTVYPGSDINKCGTADETGIFDACRRLQQGESWTFVFSEKGSWNYHDHLTAGRFGKINVV